MIEITLWAAIIAGLLSFISPCVLSLVPVYLASMMQNKTRKMAVLNSVSFVVGFSLVFVSLGALAGFFSFYALREFSWLMQLAGVIIIIFGVQIILVSLNIKWAEKAFAFLYRQKSFQVKKGKNSPVRFILLGIAFGFGWTPCIGPILGGILTLAYTQQTAGQGAFLLLVYSLALGVPFIISAIFANSISAFIKKMGRAYQVIEIISGLLLIALGILIATNQFVILNSWFYNIFS